MDRLLHPWRTALLDEFPSSGLELNPDKIKVAIKSQLDARSIRDTLIERSARPGSEPIKGSSRIFRSETYPFILLESYNPNGLAPIPDPEFYAALSFPPDYAGKSKDFAEGLWLTGRDGKYSVAVQALDLNKPGVTVSLSYEQTKGIILPSAPDSHKAAAMRMMLRLGLT